ncbi:putative interleukin-17 receptor E-like [Scomber scombrus]|uniref:putative interleukin-17 receptor E-like n=1 Tax=Scomber scombrus TaxID=13677 RepID=UPI002DD7B590|nr:putative interleukin-17 receptor E-like [Scomber scombrus]
MILFITLMMTSHCFLNGASAENMGLERIKKCSTKCSQGLGCKTKPDQLFPPPCQNPAADLNASPVFHNVSLSTVMSCEGRQKCSLHLRIKTVLQLTESIHGMTICTETAGMFTHCRILSFQKASRESMSGQQVEVEDDCTDIAPNQQVQIILKTFPDYCDITWTGTYDAPKCNNEDLRRHVSQCITGRLSYDVNPEKKELSVNVTDMLENHDYHLRLCHKHFICAGTGANALIKKEELVKRATLPYSRPLPCLCIEGWSAMIDAHRVRVCPFKDRLEELWLGINFDPLEEVLSWEPACPVAAAVALCQKREDGICEDLPLSSQNVSREKVTFTKVDPHPQLCMKFTAGSQSWIRCPFVDGRFQALEVAVKIQQGHREVKMLSQINATFSVGLCVKSATSPMCQTTETHYLRLEKHKSVGLNLTGELCKGNACLRIKRVDVKYAATDMHCFDKCDQSFLMLPATKQGTWALTWVIVPIGICLSAIITVALVLHVMLTVYQRRKERGNGGYCTSEKQTDSALICVVPTIQTHPAHLGGVISAHSPQHGHTEKANLLSH